ncbi:MAG: tRNA uridine-5-carboxymethylaminomethyl(34) synthesis GTPase MnmE [Candidatus Omnitrophota bacterium]|nr:tRNA uridine-5-carboxymethylaminomethyl(34) synthesis GTPase MnmE [Candidatus Omnitrophota bacterium]
MFKIKLDDTIVAISTPVGEGGIGIVRLSGKDAVKIADKIFVSKDGERPSTFKTYTVHYGHIVERKLPKARKRGKIVDEVILTIMRAPRSYTKEDVAEINCHSGIVPLRKILDLCLKNGARFAEPGEFTKRAFLNGRIDVAQAEAVIDIVRSKTELSLRSAINSLSGRLSKKINEVRDELVSILAHMEALIDFSEEEDTNTLQKRDILNRLKKIDKEIESFLSSSEHGRILRQGVRTVICGSPNVGKSSLMNALLKESRAIVTHIPGTTRDTIEELINIKGIPLVLVDTAGITASGDIVEKEGIKRSHFSIENADMILLVLDYARKLKKTDRDIISKIKHRDNIIIVSNKHDLKKRIDINRVKRLLPRKSIVFLSALKSQGIDKLEKKIIDAVFKGKAPSAEYVGLSNDRQLFSLRASSIDIKEAIESLKNKVSLEFITIYARSAIENIGKITGHSITEEALDKIFAEFCVGK